MPNGSIFYEAYSVSCLQEPLYRELVLADDDSLSDTIRKVRPIQAAVTAIDPLLQNDSDDFLTRLIRHTTTSISHGRYARITLISTNPAETFAGIIAKISQTNEQVLSEYRVFSTIMRTDLDPETAMCIAIGGARPIVRDEKGDWSINASPYLS